MTILRRFVSRPIFHHLNASSPAALADLSSFCLFSSSSSPTITSITGRSLFKETQVNPSILSYIEFTGVGIPKKVKRQKKRVGVLTGQEEKEVLKRKQQVGQRQLKQRPPPPFAAPTIQNDETDASGKKIQRIPVKLIGSVGFKEEQFPWSTKGIPEVVSMESNYDSCEQAS
jgi:hypothetical protein